MESTNFKVPLMKGGNEVNLGFCFNSTCTEKSKNASIAHVLKLGIFTFI